MQIENNFMLRCFDLAHLGAGNVSPNPMVGAVIVYKDKIIGEGYHKKYGGPHAEVNAVNSVKQNEKHLLQKATIYVSLEPCCIVGNTPPCTDLIIKNGIPNVVISCLDQTPGVAGKGVEILRKHNVEVAVGILKKKGMAIAKIRNTLVSENRPYIILKYARSADGFIGKREIQVWLSNIYSKYLAHKWRSETDAILVGTNTAMLDNPQLTNRLFKGPSPLRIIFDRKLKVHPNNCIYDDSVPTWIITEEPPTLAYPNKQTEHIVETFDETLIDRLLNRLFRANKSSLIVEGGAVTLQTFIDKGLWDEARVIQSPKSIKDGIKAPQFSSIPSNVYSLGEDQILQYFRGKE